MYCEVKGEESNFRSIEEVSSQGDVRWAGITCHLEKNPQKIFVPDYMEQANSKGFPYLLFLKYLQNLCLTG